ncbi:MAG TPA: twin-arginine translocase TatA/TatE family subunit [Anaerolineales bacterium]|nr:twin-arginine translocase TatA/TatE family subunit [Anaerolineales bacterium]
MEILGIGWQELLFIVVIALIVLGPRDMQKTGRTIGRWLNQLVQSDSWKVFQKTSSELRNLPRTLMRQANMEIDQTEQEIRRSIEPRLAPPAIYPSSRGTKRTPPVKRSEGQPPSREAGDTEQNDAPALRGSEGKDGPHSPSNTDEHG